MTKGGTSIDDAIMRDYYRRRAPEYEAIYARPERQVDLARLRAAVPQRMAGRRVLDVACGTGYWSAAMAGSVRELVGVDASEATLEVARAKRLGGARFAVGDAYALDGSLTGFDGAFVGFFLSHVPRRARAGFLAGLHARLVPGARVIVLDNVWVDGNSTPIAAVDADGDTWQERSLADGSRHRVLKNHPSRAELLRLVAHVATRTHWWRLEHYWLLEYTFMSSSVATGPTG